MLRIESHGTTVAYIDRPSKMADGHIKEAPWLLLYVRGRVERYATQLEAKAEARKSWPAVSIRRA